MSLTTRILIAPAILLAISARASDRGEDYSRSFRLRGREYQVRFVEVPDRKTWPHAAWPMDLVMRWRVPGGNTWHVVSRVEGVRLEKTVRVPGPHGRDIDALVVSAPGGSAQFISVIEISKSPPKLRVPLDRALDKGGFHYLRDRVGRLTGLKFEYQAWHVEAKEATGHVFTARDAVWDAKLHRFCLGQPYVDAQREKAASLLDVLTAIGSAELLGMEESRDGDFRIYAYTYEPTGLLLEKTPPKLRSAKRVRVVVDRGASPDSKPRIASIEAAGM